MSQMIPASPSTPLVSQHIVNYENIYKLATKEDSSHIHKILGGIVLLNYGYRYLHYIMYGNMNFKTNIDLYILFLHGILSISSLIFHISHVRNPQQPMIYPEYRMHSILFALRSVLCCLVHYYDYHYKNIIVICALTLVSADMITMHYNPYYDPFYNKKNLPGNGKTMRNMPFDKSVSSEDRQLITYMHSYHQIGATLYMFGNIDMAFSPMFAIQLAAFLMTLVRKGIINGKVWHSVYSLSLWINYILFTSISPSYFFLISTNLHIHTSIVFRYKIHKYIGWAFHFLCIICYKEGGYAEKIDHIILDNYSTEWYFFIRFFTIMVYSFLFYKYRVIFM